MPILQKLPPPVLLFAGFRRSLKCCSSSSQTLTFEHAMVQKIKRKNQPGHLCVLHFFACLPTPGHFAPPWAGTGLLHCLVRC